MTRLRRDNPGPVSSAGRAPSGAVGRGARRVALVMILAVGLVVYLSSTRVFRYGVDSEEIIAHLFQAHVFAMGRIHVESPPEREAFDTEGVVNDGRMFSRCDPGHPALLALGHLLLPSFKLVLAVIAMLNAFLTYRIALELWQDPRVAALAVAVLLLSPFFIVASSIELPHTSLLLSNGIFLLAFFRTLRADRAAHFIAGLALGAALNTRLVEAASFALPFFVFLGLRAAGLARANHFLSLRPTRARLAGLGLFASGLAVLFALRLVYNLALTGDAWSPPLQLSGALTSQHLSFDLLDSPHHVFDRYYFKHLYAISFLADHFFLLSMSYPILMALFILVARDRGSIMLVSTLIVFPLPLLAYQGYGEYAQTEPHGPLELFPLVLPLALMSARLLVQIHRRLPPGAGSAWPAALALAYFTVEGTVRADLPRWLGRQAEVTRSRAALRAEVMPPSNEHALVFVVRNTLGEGDGMFWNYPPFTDQVLFARHRGIAADLALQRLHFPDRTIFVGKTRVDPTSFINTWDLLGPYYAPFPGSLDTPWIDESSPEAFQPSTSPAVWTLHEAPDQVVDLAAAYSGGRLDNAVAYARAIITATAATPAFLRYGSDDGIAIWLNGELLAREPLERSAELDQSRVAVQLRAGRNLLLVKVSQLWNPWQFVLRVTDPSGVRPPGLVFSTPLLELGARRRLDPRRRRWRAPLTRDSARR